MIKNQVFRLRGEWFVVFNSIILRYSWLEKGPAQACLDLLVSGYGELTPERGVRYVEKKGTRP